ncbi:hypothetical protein [Streptomyces sp. NPDC004685]
MTTKATRCVRDGISTLDRTSETYRLGLPALPPTANMAKVKSLSPLM